MRATSTIKFRAAAAAMGVAAASMLLAAGLSGPTLASTAASGTGDCDSVTTCYTPGQLRVAYGIQPLTDRGIDGRGETVVIPALAESQPNPPAVSDLRQDMADFDKLFGLPAPRMQVVTSLAGPASPWLSYGEETLDAEMVHAIAPRAAITIVLLKPADLATPAAAAAALTAMLKIGATHGDVISISAGWGEDCFTSAEAASLHTALLYRIASTALYRTAFHDITTGNNTVEFPPRVFTGYQGTRGWDPVTGLGSPDAEVLVPLLAR